MKIKAEYIWIDGKTPTAKLRSKTKIMDQGTEPPIWGFDGSSTEQATGDQSDCVLKPVAQFPDCLLYTSPSPRDLSTSRMPSSA